MNEQQLQQIMQSSITEYDPLGFSLAERIMKHLTRERAPKWSPSLILSPGGLRRYQLGQETIRKVDEECELAWQRMTASLLQSHHDLMNWKANQGLRDLMHAEAMRNRQDEMELDFEFQVRTMQLHLQERMVEEQFNIAAQSRAHQNEKELITLKAEMQLLIERGRAMLNDPAYSTDRLLQGFDMLSDKLREINANPSDSAAVKHQRATTVMDAWIKKV